MPLLKRSSYFQLRSLKRLLREAAELPGIGDYFADIELDQAVIGKFSKPLNVEMLPMPGGYARARRSGGNLLPPLSNPKQARPNRAPIDKFKGLESSLRTLH